MSIKRYLLLVVTAEALIILLGINNYGFNIEGLQAATRFSGRLSLGVFSLIFILLPRNRKELFLILSTRPFLIFAVAHGIHLIELVSYVYLSQTELIPIRLAGGALAYIMIFSLPVIQFYYELGTISEKKYFLAENIYQYYVWFIFFMSYLPRVQGKLPHVGGTYQEFVILLAWVCILLGMKLSAAMARRFNT